MEQNLVAESWLHNKHIKYIAWVAGRNQKDFEGSAGEGWKDNEETNGVHRTGSHCHAVTKSLATLVPAIAWKIKFA